MSNPECFISGHKWIVSESGDFRFLGCVRCKLLITLIKQ